MSNSRTTPPVSTGGVVIARSIERSMLAVLCALFLLAFLTSCGPTDPSSGPPSGGPAPTTGKPIASISAPAPPGSADRPLEPGQGGTPYMPNGLPVLPARGLNADTLFAEKVTDPDDRFRRLENAVVDLRREFDAVAPAIVRLSAVEQDMQTLITQLQTLVQDAPPAPVMDLDSAPVEMVTEDALPPSPGLAPEDTATPEEQGLPPAPEPPAPAPVPQAALPPATAPPPETAAPAASAPIAAPQPGQIAVSGIRTGQQDNGVIRLVLDLTGPATYSFDLDNNEHLLLIELPQAGWSAASTGTFAAAPLLTSWTTEPMEGGKGTRLVIQLRQKVTVVSDSTLTDPARIVLDLKQQP